MSTMPKNPGVEIVNQIGFNTNLGLTKWLRSESLNPNSKYKGCYYKVHSNEKTLAGHFTSYDGSCRYLLTLYSGYENGSYSLDEAKDNIKPIV